MVTKESLQTFFQQEFPHASFTVEELGSRRSRLRLDVTQQNLRPGGTVSGPTLMGIADAALYAAILHEIGMLTLAVTSNFTINFLRKPEADRAIIAECRLMKIGKTLAMGEVSLYSEGENDVVAHVVGTYALPKS